MVGVFVVILSVAALVAALQPAHRRAWRPGLDVRNDRDRGRLLEELRLLEGFEPAPVPRAAAEEESCQELDSAAAA